VKQFPEICFCITEDEVILCGKDGNAVGSVVLRHVDAIPPHTLPEDYPSFVGKTQVKVMDPNGRPGTANVTFPLIGETFEEAIAAFSDTAQKACKEQLMTPKLIVPRGTNNN